MTAAPAPDFWRADAYASGARFVADYGAALLDALDPRPGERVLDLGCGDGALTAEIAAQGAIVTGVDASPDMVAAARARGLDAQAMRAEALAFDAAFDAVFSNAALHWITDQQAALDGAARALRPGGRLVAEMGGHGNVAAIRTALSATLAARAGIETDLSELWLFPTPAEQTARLEAAGFADIRIALIPRPTPLPGSMVEWLRIFAAQPLAALAEAERAPLLAAVSDRLAPALRDRSGAWTADYVRLRFTAVKPAP